ncbi:polysaccharide pyruvyl transferase family protein [Alkalimonas collagenimarina]|uniref:Polysaccharide pyruvyl transferase family protein n=1 Tax=Alkalimonas collagenimarina TaxID=400390 RepID=A0ABT9H0V5_9GAMM|nr:polysaccharide pyruvyl transferase family protein [Alkalimonas collagenimarina]MDP4536908.1 polysaccharide pyruvyl transferase family protein [Alkalimonas collagenimarina]
MMIEIKGVQFINKGAELMLQAVLQQMQQHWPDAELVLAPNPNSSYINRAKLGAYQKWSIRKNILDLNSISYYLPKALRRWLKRTWGVVTEADIDVVLDASGFAYGDQWGFLSTKAMAGEVKRAHANGKKYIFLPQALGPFTREKDRSYLLKALPKASLICAREETSFAHVKGLIGDTSNLVQFPDFTNLVQGIVPDDFTNGANKVLIIPNSNMISSRNQHAAWQQHYLRVLVDAVHIVRDMGLEPVLLNHEGKGDEAICSQVQQQAGGELPILNEADPLKVKGIIGASKAVICSRFHGCVSALSQGVPCIGTSWSHKYERLYEEYQQSDSLISPEISREALQQTLEQAIATVDAEEKQQARAHFKQLSEQMWQKVVSLV